MAHERTPMDLATAGLSPEFAVQAQRLRTILRVAQGGGSFIFVVCNSVPARIRLIAALAPELSEALTATVTADQLDPYAAAHAASLTRPDDRPPAAVVVLNLDEYLASDLLGARAMAALNASRELWWSRFACPVLFFVSDATLDKLALGAPDLWSRRSHVVTLPELDAQRALVQPPTALGTSPVSTLFDDIKRWPVPRREARLVELQALLARESTDGGRDSQMRRERWLTEMGLLHYAMQRREPALEAFSHAQSAALAAGLDSHASAAALWRVHVLLEQGRLGDADTALGLAHVAPVGRSELTNGQDYLLRGTRATLRALSGDLAGASDDIDAAIRWGEARSPRDERGLAIWYASRADIRRLRGDLAGAEADIKKSIDWGEAQSPRDERSLAIWYASRASIRQSRGDLAGAEADIAKSITWGESQSPRDERGLAAWYASRASIRQDRGDLAGAEADIQKSIDWYEAQSPRDERSLAIDYASRANIRQDRGDLAGAEKDIERSIAWGEAQSSRDERTIAIWYSWRARIRQARGDLAGAEADIQRSIDSGEAQSPRDERSLAIRYASRAGIRLDRDDLAGAEADIQRSIDWGEAQSPRDERSLAICYETKALIFAEAGRFPEAKAAIDRCVLVYQQVFGPDSHWTKNALRRQQAIHAGKYPG